uniref:outer membrane protein assembly factor BamB family protein n=1 Tax=Acetivibrio cellulolyticus TaxID=35830 RepID=UPI0013C358E3|nr:PQQ-binding-like beta-propeller repeat protein [Acetivibrio cellulolyticus]
MVLNLTACNNGKNLGNKTKSSSVEICEQTGKFLVCLSIDGLLQCLDISNQTVLWNQKFSIYGKNTSSHICEDKLIFAVGNELIHIDLKTGKKLWKSRLDGSISWIFADDNEKYIVVSTENDLICCFDKESNKKLWSKKYRNAALLEPVTSGDSLIFQWRFNGSKYVQGAIEHKIYSVDITNGNELWAYESKTRLLPSLFTSENSVIFSDAEGTITSLNKDTGKTIWTYATNKEQRDLYCNMALFDNTLVFFHTEGQVYFLDKNTGSKTYDETTNKAIIKINIYNDIAIIVCDDGTINFYDIINKKPLNSLSTASKYYKSIKIKDDLLYVLGTDGSLYAYGINDYKEVWNYKSRIIESEIFISGNQIIFVSTKTDRSTEFVILDRLTGKEVKVIN